MPNDLMVMAAPVVAQAVTYALQFAGESVRKGLQGDLYTNLREAVWNRILSKKPSAQEVAVFTELSAHPEEADKRREELIALMTRIEAQLDETIVELSRQVMENPPTQTVTVGRDNIQAGRDYNKAGRDNINAGRGNVFGGSNNDDLYWETGDPSPEAAATLLHFNDLSAMLEATAELLQREVADDLSKRRTTLAQMSKTQDSIQKKIDEANAWLARRAG